MQAQEVARIRRCAVVLPDRIIGPFESEDDAKDYVAAMYGYKGDENSDLAWSIKPVETP
jgi:hypothetical protein